MMALIQGGPLSRSILRGRAARQPFPPSFLSHSPFNLDANSLRLRLVPSCCFFHDAQPACSRQLYGWLHSDTRVTVRQPTLERLVRVPRRGFGQRDGTVVGESIRTFVETFYEYIMLTIGNILKCRWRCCEIRLL